MKAIKVMAPGGLDRLALVDLADPGAPRAGEIRVRLQASSLNYHDYQVAARPGRVADGRIPMADGAGVVEAVGDGVTQYAVGDMVVSCFSPLWQDGPPRIGDFASVPGDGVDGYARAAVVSPQNWFTHAPKGYSAAQAATLTTAGLTAWRALVVEGAMKAGDTVLVLGSGGVSLFALQFAKAMGAHVIATSSSDEKLERFRNLGADHVINYRREPEWGQRAFELTGGIGVDHVVDIGGPATLPQSMAAARVGGHVSMIGTLTGGEGPIPTRVLLLKQIRIHGIIVGSRRHQIDMVQGIDAIALKPVIDRSFALEEIADSFRYEESGRHFGKICLEY